MSSRSRWVLALVALAAIVAIGLNQASQTKTPEPTSRERSAAEIRTKLAGAPAALASLHRQANALLPGQRSGLQARLRALRGHPVVVNVWAAWCGPCRAELPLFQRASVDWGTRVAFLGVDLRDSRGSAVRLSREFPVSYPSYEDPRGRIANGYRLVGTPSTIFYAASGKRTYIHQGAYRTRGELDADIRRYAAPASQR
jgi:cytochrome c biogenesis protein CcmG, thiol:disulfide interchange protein DsbE